MLTNKIIKLETCKSTNSYALENFQKFKTWNSYYN
jgi:hypothetical protein